MGETVSIHDKVARALQERVRSPLPLNNINELNLVLRLLAKWRSQLLANTFVQHHGRIVFQGPFAGMNYVARTTEGALIARLLGVYESELHPSITDFANMGLDCVIDVGCAEGYYAVGLARLMPSANVYAYDIDPKARAACAQMAQANDVADRVEIRELFTPEVMDEFAGRKCLLIMDAEGAEDDLLRPERSAAFADTYMIVETHDGAKPGVLRRIVERCSATHDIEILQQSGRMAKLPPWLNTLGHLDQLLAVWEWRSTPTPWLVMRPKGRAEAR